MGDSAREEKTAGPQQPRRRRRSRRRRGSGQGRAGQKDQQNQQSRKPDAKQDGRDAQSGQKQGGGQRRKRGPGYAGTSSSSSRRRGGRGRRGGSGRPSQRRGTRRGPARGRESGQPQLRTSLETSAGGLVVSGLAEAVRDDGSVDLSRIYVALIGRLDRRGRLLWSMPKGHVENKEDHAATAEREVWEETGVRGSVVAELGTIDYWFVLDGKRIHKTVHHHLLRYVDGDLNDEDPEVTEVQWVPAEGLVERLAYADERKLARRAADMLPDVARAERAAGRRTPR